jgi:TolB-like protein
LEYILAFSLVKRRSYRFLSFGFVIARQLSFQSAESTQLWKKLRLSIGRSFSVDGSVRKLGLGVAGTGGVL